MEFLVLPFRLGPGPRKFTKLMKVPIATLRRLNIRVVIYLDDMLLRELYEGDDNNQKLYPHHSSKPRFHNKPEQEFFVSIAQ